MVIPPCVNRLRNFKMHNAEDILSSLPVKYYYIDYTGKLLSTNQISCKVGCEIVEIFDIDIANWIQHRLHSYQQKNIDHIPESYQTYGNQKFSLSIKPYLSGALICKTTHSNPQHRQEIDIQTDEQKQRFIYAALDALNDYVYAFDRDAKFIYVNVSMRILYGEDLNPIGKTLKELDYPDALAAKLNQEIESIFKTGKAVKDEVHFVSRTGFSAYFDYIYAPVFDNLGNVECVIGMSRDSTQRKNLEQKLYQNEKRLSAIFEILPIGLAVMDNNGGVSLQNEHWQKMAAAIPYFQQNTKLKEFFDLKKESNKLLNQPFKHEENSSDGEIS
ncbi:MAG: PAS domain S-box protein, partial [Pedobacter sp.]